MNKLMVIMVLFFSLSLGAQQAVFKGLLVDSTGRGYVQGAEIHFVRNDTSVWTTIPAGHFYMSLHKFLSDTVIITHQVWGTLRFTINLKDRSVKDTLIRLPLACRTHPVSDICPVCKSNKDVIPVIYGLPSEKTFERAKRNLIYLGGCMINDCSPQHYCKKDKMEF